MSQQFWLFEEEEEEEGKEEDEEEERKEEEEEEVEASSPAQRVGLLDGELLLEVNGEPVQALPHEDVVERIKQSSPQVTLTTISAQGLDFYSKLGLSPLLFCGDIAGETQPEMDNVLPAVAEETPEEVGASLMASLEESAANLSASSEEGMAQRRCVIEKGPLGYGLDFDCVQHTPGTIVSQVTPGGPAHRAGLSEGDTVIEVNGHNVEGKRPDKVATLVQAAGSHLSLVVMPRGCHGNDTTCSTSDPGDSEVR
ncbi:hypothetical protein CRUP_033941 [Coryphaenoides rupestris]|nr:hypothetical protein CRUP_033941 [Coryphaenoides rupestris]